MCQFTLGVKLLSHISHCQTDSCSLRAEECSFYTSILSHIFKYHLGYVKEWFDNAGSHLSGMTVCLETLHPACKQPSWGSCGSCAWAGTAELSNCTGVCGVPSQMQNAGLDCPASPAATSLAPHFSSEKIVFSGAHTGHSGAAC